MTTRSKLVERVGTHKKHPSDEGMITQNPESLVLTDLASYPSMLLRISFESPLEMTFYTQLRVLR